MRCLSVSVFTFVDSVKMNKHIFKIFSLWGIAKPFCSFSAPNGMAIFWRKPPNRGVECRWGRQKSRFWAYIWLHCVLSTLQPARCYQHGGAGPRSRKWLTHPLHILLPPKVEKHYSTRPRGHCYELPRKTSALGTQFFIVYYIVTFYRLILLIDIFILSYCNRGLSVFH